jgi:hypothetical protein
MTCRCLFSHRWVGCRCARCGKPRDAEHDWVLDHCHRVCRRCRLPGGWRHDWDGCVCRVCGEGRHVWSGRRCKRCGKELPYPPICQPPEGHDVSATGWTAH